MLLINAVQAAFVSILLYFVICLVEYKWHDPVIMLPVFGITFIIAVGYDIVIDSVIKWFNKERKDDTFRGY